jgi:DNA replication and repair protein RecF
MNREELDLSFGPGLQCITGPNGVGKTNILEAIHYLCLTKGYLNHSDIQHIRWTPNDTNRPDFFMIEGLFKAENAEDLVQCSARRGQKKIVKRNKKEYEQLSRHIGLFPVVMVAPQDSELLSGGSEVRRRFMDLLISQYNREYLEQLMVYNKILHQRNVLLKQMAQENRKDSEILAIFDMQMEIPGEKIIEIRLEFMHFITPLFQEFYRLLSGGNENVELILETNAQAKTLRNAFWAGREDDLRLKYTSRGPHKDELACLLEGKPIRKFGSQGQQKTFLTALKLAEFEVLKSRSKRTPLLLLDDIFDKLDQRRVARLLQLLWTKAFEQVFITDTGDERLKFLLNEMGIEAEFTELLYHGQ